MDALSNLLRGVRADGVLLSRNTPSPPWSLRVTSDTPLTLCSPLRGTGWLVFPGDEAPVHLHAGDIAIVRGPLAFSFVDDLGSATDPRVRSDTLSRSERRHSGPSERTLPEASERTLPELVEGHHPANLQSSAIPEGSSALLVGEYPVRGEVGRRLLDVLPPVLVVPAEPACEDILDFIASEISADQPGQQVVLERLLDWILVCTLRAWFDSPDSAAPAWYHAMGDPVIGAALRAIHDDHARPWTVASLATVTGVSRALLAKRFTELVGEPPLTYLTGWRMAVAADLLAEPGATVAGVARRVGYADAFGFSAAFKRTRGHSPSAFRRALAAVDDAGSAADLVGSRT